MLVSLKSAELGLLDSQTRIAFRYGSACLTACPQAVLEVVVEAGGTRVSGYSGDCLPPLWFDKDPAKSFERQVDDMLMSFRSAAACYRSSFAQPRLLFRGWLEAHRATLADLLAEGRPALLASFASSLLERALLDAVCRAAGLTFFDCIVRNVPHIQPGDVHQELRDLVPRDWLPAAPRRRILVRQTVGLGDPLSRADLGEGTWPDDGYPVALEEYIEKLGVRYFKVKVSNQLEPDLHRLRQFAALVERHRGADYRLTLDGNEQYTQAGDFDALISAIESQPELSTLWRNTLAVEQPLARSVALSAEHTGGIRELSARKPVIIDESDGELSSYRQALDLGYRGVSSKNCKGAFKSLLNAGLNRHFSRVAPERPLLITGEDLCSVGIIPVQADLCLAATLGLEHVERNGHHYHRGLSYLPESEQRAALRWHGDFYHEHAGRIAPCICQGEFAVDSLQCVGFGFAVRPDLGQRQRIPLG